MLYVHQQGDKGLDHHSDLDDGMSLQGLIARHERRPWHLLMSTCQHLFHAFTEKTAHVSYMSAEQH